MAFELTSSEWTVVALVTLAGLAVSKLGRDFVRGLRMGAEEFAKASGDIQRDLSDAANATQQQASKPERSELDRALWVAQGFGAGRLKPAPGTWGSLVGLLWFAALVGTGSVWGFLAGTLLSIPVSASFCGLAEKALGEKDPGSVVLDEIIAVPLCFGAWVVSIVNSSGRMPDASYFFSGNNWLGVAAIFGAFRFFDIWKPWPVRQSQSLPGGWGVTVDDLLAALYVNLVSLPFLL